MDCFARRSGCLGCIGFLRSSTKANDEAQGRTNFADDRSSQRNFGGEVFFVGNMEDKVAGSSRFLTAHLLVLLLPLALVSVPLFHLSDHLINGPIRSSIIRSPRYAFLRRNWEEGGNGAFFWRNPEGDYDFWDWSVSQVLLEFYDDLQILCYLVFWVLGSL